MGLNDQGLSADNFPYESHSIPTVEEFWFYPFVDLSVCLSVHLSLSLETLNYFP